MKCPFCSFPETRVTNSRLFGDGDAIRRRRQCVSCQRRFTTYERVEKMMLLVVKKDGRREPFDRQKIIAGILRACEKRPVSLTTIEEMVNQIEAGLLERGEREVETQDIGEAVMHALHDVDQVAYVRFASVYREFKDLGEFMLELKDLLKKQQ
ncbi:MAG: transcriptional repressor NrdR [Deltaproteobacteria bacterium]|nr:transcriptional repressor NrdR [Deltaproteobacteria bacterium]MBQ7248425.1 transcriptional repressor NrdR [Deltaproteobacteria bacterium]MBR5346683.1 transcriptional repressor NrdR [Deltaproteobacteria bacterium]MBR5704348.1 transcriptional repressor NrdR [Deltaproteobacteria bacterium]MBR5998147.1 transcriptional repressor NrdR [Deltaproteobacteria bacterium]